MRLFLFCIVLGLGLYVLTRKPKPAPVMRRSSAVVTWAYPAGMYTPISWS